MAHVRIKWQYLVSARNINRPEACHHSYAYGQSVQSDVWRSLAWSGPLRSLKCFCVFLMKFDSFSFGWIYLMNDMCTEYYMPTASFHTHTECLRESDGYGEFYTSFYNIELKQKHSKILAKLLPRTKKEYLFIIIVNSRIIILLSGCVLHFNNSFEFRIKHMDDAEPSPTRHHWLTRIIDFSFYTMGTINSGSRCINLCAKWKFDPHVYKQIIKMRFWCMEIAK